MLISIKNRADVYNYRFTGFCPTTNASEPQAITYEYLLNTKMISTVKFYENYEHPYSVNNFGEGVEVLQSIVIGIGSDYEVLAFTETAALEFKRIKRDLEVAFVDVNG